ncbi:MAG: hypothetical protein ACOH2T_26340 [Pseudomonas sp.]
MQETEKWVIKKPDGQSLLSFGIDAAQIHIGWFRPDSPGKTKEGKKGPLTFHAIAKAQALLTALVTLVPNEFSDAVVADVGLSVADSN